jgi:hypothetical protein
MLTEPYAWQNSDCALFLDYFSSGLNQRVLKKFLRYWNSKWRKPSSIVACFVECTAVFCLYNINHCSLCVCFCVKVVLQGDILKPAFSLNLSITGFIEDVKSFDTILSFPTLYVVVAYG